MQNTQPEVARILLEIGAVKFTPDEPVTFKSGIRSPIYVDNRIIPYHPRQWRRIIIGFHRAIQSQGEAFDIIAGIETGGIPHSSVLGYSLRKPSIYVRKQAKGHGTRSKIEGGEVAGKRVLLIEDAVTTGGSSLAGVEALRAAGALVEDCIAIVSFGFRETLDAFTEAGVRLHTLTRFDLIIRYALEMGQLSQHDVNLITDWLRDPHNWMERHGESS